MSQSQSIGSIGWLLEAAGEFSIGESSAVRDGKTTKVESLQEILHRSHC